MGHQPTATRAKTGVIGHRLDQRVFTVIPLSDLPAVLEAGGVAHTSWSNVAPIAESTDAVVLVTTARAVSSETLETEHVPWSAITLIGVANDPVRERVRSVFAAHTAMVSTKVAVNPPWFQSSSR